MYKLNRKRTNARWRYDMLEQYENEIKKLEKYLTTFYGNTSSVRMKKYAIEKKIAKYQDIVDEMKLILAMDK